MSPTANDYSSLTKLLVCFFQFWLSVFFSFFSPRLTLCWIFLQDKTDSSISPHSLPLVSYGGHIPTGSCRISKKQNKTKKQIHKYLVFQHYRLTFLLVCDAYSFHKWWRENEKGKTFRGSPCSLTRIQVQVWNSGTEITISIFKCAVRYSLVATLLNVSFVSCFVGIYCCAANNQNAHA